MKKNELFLIGGGLIFSLLFYQQIPGINFLLITIMLTIIIVLVRPANTQKTEWWAYCLAANAAGLSVFINNSALSVIATVFSTIIFSSKSLYIETSTPVNLGYGFYSLARSPFDLVSGSYLRSGGTNKGTARQKSRILVTGVLTALLFAALFLMLYRFSNPLFDQKMAGINFNWLNMEWIIFTLFSMVIVNGLVFTKKIELVEDLDQMLKRDLTGEEQPGRQLSYDAVIAITLFGLLNLMLIVINLLDINNLYINKQLPDGITLSQFVHGAVETLILSIIIGAGLIAWLLRGSLNFSYYGKLSRSLIYTWIAQNILVIISTMIRNTWYIQEYQLTEQRIGVFVFLVLVAACLYLTFLKVRKLKSAWWLASMSFQLGFTMLVCTSLINWDKQITAYNISHASSHKPLDFEYLVQLSDANLPQLVTLHNNYILSPDEKKMLYKKLHTAYLENRFQQWPSFSLRMKKSNQALLETEM